MLKYSIKRLARSLITLIILITIVFALLRFMPEEGYFNNYEKMSPAQIELGLIKMGLTEFDQEKRAEIYKEWAARQNELVPTLIVAYRSEIWGINNRVHGLDDIGVYTDWTQLISKVTLD